ncbi:MAG TPA: coproporphyrinogen III oxidase [Kofleriaceae bacterium]|nr:coproporphyrinogen III oxidase [Kofleriaceae bacterium]
MRTLPSSATARAATALVEALQQRFVAGLEAAAAAAGMPARLAPVEWLRDDGRHGGGVRWGTADSAMFGRASINVSTVHYDDLPDRKLASASALSSIVHPADPRRPSMHLHVSWTEMRDGSGYWRVMADLNPALPDHADRQRFIAALREAAPEQYDAAAEQGDRYFFIPALGRHRGVTHFYLEAYTTGDWDRDAALARRVEEAAISTYCSLLQRPLAGVASAAERAAQLAYHTVYLFQVLTLDRGTTSGLMVHDQNDEGIMGSLPPSIDPVLLASWAKLVPPPQGELVDRLVAVLAGTPASSGVTVDAAAKHALAKAVREHYRLHPRALDLQASGDVVPPTVSNHQAIS